MDSFAVSRFPTISHAMADGAVGLSSAHDMTKSDAPSDETLVAGVCEGSSEALAKLFGRYARIAYGIGQRILRDHAETEDLVQDIFLYIHRKSHVYNTTKGSASSWIVQTIYYQAFQRRIRLAARHRSFRGIESIERDVGTTAMKYDHSIEGIVGRAKLREMLDSLTEDQWETLRLHFFEGYTLSEIARKREQSLGNIRHHFYRGLEKLRSHVFRSELQDRITSDTR
jgi:RNA polymerase sigma-70 factor, ECF subfamily